MLCNFLLYKNPLDYMKDTLTKMSTLNNTDTQIFYLQDTHI